MDTFKHVASTKEVENENLITYFVDTRNHLNEICNERVVKEKGLPPLITQCYEGQKLVFSDRYDHKDGTIYRNYIVTFRRFVNDGESAIIFEPFEDKEYLFKTSTLLSKTRRSHAVTCHSKQGASISGNTYIFDVTSVKATKKWLYVAVSRNTQIWNNYIYTGPALRIDPKDLTNTIKRMIESHRRADEKAGRSFSDDRFGGASGSSFITVADVMMMLHTTRFCPWCQGDVTQGSFSIDRIDSELAHIKGNCQLLCSSKCNSAKRKNFEAVI